MKDRSRRQRMIADLIGRHTPDGSPSVHSQEQLRDMLAKSGVEVTQGTLSRDLRSLGVVKGPSGYILPGGIAGMGAASRVGPLPRLTLTNEIEEAVRQYSSAVGHAGTIVVLRTSAGHAGVVAVAIDRFPPKGVVGTVAGDDTIFVAVRSSAEAARLAKYFRSLLA